MKSQFEDYYSEIDMAKNGDEALQAITNNRYELILLDLQMPKLTGMELIKKIKNAHCLNADSPIIAITAHAQIDQRQKVIEAGFDDCLIKPVLPEHLITVINTCLNKKTTALTPPAPSANNKPADYVEIMLDKTKNNKELAINLFTKLFEELPGQILVIKQACNKEDLQLAEATTHKLHGSASFCGLQDIQLAARILETTLANQDNFQINSNLEQLEKMVSQFLDSKQKIFDKLSH